MLGQQDGTGLGPLLVGALMNAVALYSIGISTADPKKFFSVRQCCPHVLSRPAGATLLAIRHAKMM